MRKANGETRAPANQAWPGSMGAMELGGGYSDKSALTSSQPNLKGKIMSLFGGLFHAITNPIGMLTDPIGTIIDSTIAATDKPSVPTPEDIAD